MARMYPEHLEGFEEATEGEKKVFAFLEEAAKPHKDFACWYQPSLGSQGKVPDFVLYGKKLGLLVLEVKDWWSFRTFRGRNTRTGEYDGSFPWRRSCSGRTWTLQEKFSVTLLAGSFSRESPALSLSPSKG